MNISLFKESLRAVYFLKTRHDSIFKCFFLFKIKSRMRTLLSSENSAPYSRFQAKSSQPEFKNRTTLIEKSNVPGKSLKIKRDDLSPVSKFREEQQANFQSKQTTPATSRSNSINKASKAPYFYDQLSTNNLTRATESSDFSKMSNKPASFDDIANRTYLNSTSTINKSHNQLNPSKRYNYAYEPNRKRISSYNKVEYSDNEDDKVY